MSKKNESTLDYEIITPGKIIPRITIINSGPPRCGKTTLALSMPDPIAVLSNDVNTRIICEKGAAAGKKILFKELVKRPQPVIRLGGATTVDEQNEHKKYWKEFRDAYYRFVDMKDVRSILVDTGTRMYEDARYAYLGRVAIDTLNSTDQEQKNTKVVIEKVTQIHYGPVMDEIRDMLNYCDQKNLMVNHYDRDEFINNVRTGRRTFDGMKGINYLGQVETWQYRDQETGEFRIVLMNSTANGDIRGRKGDFDPMNGKYRPGPDELTGEDVNFAMVALQVHPESDWEMWN